MESILIILIVIILIGVLVLVGPFILIFGAFNWVANSYKRRKFLKQNEGKVFFCVTKGNRQKGFINNYRTLIESHAIIDYFDTVFYNDTVVYSMKNFIDEGLGFPQIVKIENGKVRAKSLKKEYKLLSRSEYKTADFVEIVKNELLQLAIN